MSPAKKFTFDTEFQGTQDVVSQAARARQKRTLTTEEIEAMCAQARAEGAQTGQARTNESLSQMVAALTIAVRAALESSRAEIETLRAEAAGLALAAARKIVPVALAALPAGDVEATLREAMHQAISEPRLVLRAAPQVIAAIEDRIQAIAHEEGYDGRVLLTPESRLAAADCRIEWRGGGGERSQAAIETALDAIVTRRFSQLSSAPKG